MTTTRWNGIEIEAIRGTAVVAEAEFPNYWARSEGIVGERIPVVYASLNGASFRGGEIYLDNRDGSGWEKVTTGNGMPHHGHREVQIEDGSFEGDR